MDPGAIVIEPENFRVSYRHGDTDIKPDLEIIMHGVSHYDAILG
jgi:hypothetical protein